MKGKKICVVAAAKNKYIPRIRARVQKGIAYSLYIIIISSRLKCIEPVLTW